MTKRSFFFSWIPVLAILFCISCSKDQTALNRLKGEWELTSYTEGGVTISSQPGTTFHLIFEKCKEGETCTVTTRQTDGTNTNEYTTTYQVTNDGKILLMDSEIIKIVELTTKKLTIDNENDDIILGFEKL